MAETTAKCSAAFAAPCARIRIIGSELLAGRVRGLKPGVATLRFSAIHRSKARPRWHCGGSPLMFRSWMFRSWASLAAVLLLTMACASAQQPAAPSRLDDIIKRGTLRVGMTGDYLPFTYFDKTTSAFRGFDVDMAEALGKALGVRVEYVQTAWPKLMADFEAGTFDIAMGGVSITLDRQKKGMFSTPIMREGKTPIARCSNKDKFETIAEIDKPGTRVIVNPGGTN